MTGLIVTLMLFVGVPLLAGARSRIGRLEHRLRLVEEELRRRIAMGAERLPEKIVEPVKPVEPEPEPEPEQEPEQETEPELEPEPELPVEVEPREPVPAMPLAIPATRIQREVEPEPVAADAVEDEQGYEPEPATKRAAINFEELFGRRLPIWAGGITLAIAGVLIVKYAIDAGFFARVFTPGVQAIGGALFGLGLIGGAEWAWRKREAVQDPRVSQALSGAGISTLYAALLVAANVYGLISPLTAFFGLAVVTAGALWLSLRHGMPSALLGLAGGLAAPALTVGLDAHVPMLATYLAFTIGGLVGVSRVQRWPWLAAIALTGGAGWSLWLILAGKAMTTFGALSVGTFVLLLAIALPMLAFRGAAVRMLRALAAVVGAVQLAMLVAMGGYQPLHWGLFALIAAAGQWLAWRDRGFAVVPTLGAVLSVLLLLLWPAPSGGWLALIGLTLAAIHSAPLLARLWQEPARLQRAIELSGIAVAAPLVTLHHFHVPWGALDPLAGITAFGGAQLVLLGAGLGRKVGTRADDSRFALLLASGGALLSVAAWFAFAHWQAPLWIGAVAVTLLLLSRPARDWRIEPLAAAFSGVALVTLLGTIQDRWNEALVLLGLGDAPTNGASLARWSGLALVFALFSWRGASAATRLPAWTVLIALAYGVAAQLVPEWTLPIALAALTGLALSAMRFREEPAAEAQLPIFAGGAIVLLGLTGAHPLGEWLRLADFGDAPVSLLALARWASLAALGLHFALRSRLMPLRGLGQFAAIVFGYGALAQVVPGWSLPIAMAAVAATGFMALLRSPAKDSEWQLVVFGAGATVLLAITGADPVGEWQRLVGAGDGSLDGAALARWASLAAFGVLLAARSRLPLLRGIGQVTAALAGYGALAQVVPLFTLPPVPALAVLGLALWSRKLEWPRLRPASVALAAVSAAWAVLPLMLWFDGAVRSLGGVPMELASPDLAPLEVIRRLLAPALLLGASAWRLRQQLSLRVLRLCVATLGVLMVVALHSLYRAAFAEFFGSDFVATGLGQRLLWDGLLLALAVLLWKRGTGLLASNAAPVIAGLAAWHVTWYSLLLHNPLWTAQAVGALPLANLILPLFTALPLCLLLISNMRRDLDAKLDLLFQPIAMIMIALFGWASLRQSFHGTMLVEPGLGQLEDILRSILGIGLAIGYLLWGIRRRRHNWRIASLVLVLAAVAKVFLFDASGLTGLLRIASFVALGFSLIGIGWLYSRQLRSVDPG